MASEYGWTHRDILYNTYPEEFFLLQRQISMRKTDEYLMQVGIVANPHKNPEDAKEFIDSLLKQRRFYRGIEEASERLDVTMFNKLRTRVTKESKLMGAK